MTPEWLKEGEEGFGGERGWSVGRQLTSTASDVLRPDDAWRPGVTRQLGDVCWHIACRIAAAASAPTALLTRIAQTCFTITSATTRPVCAESAARRLADTCSAATDASWGSCTDTQRENETGGDGGGGEGNGGDSGEGNGDGGSGNSGGGGGGGGGGGNGGGGDGGGGGVGKARNGGGKARNGGGGEGNGGGGGSGGGFGSGGHPLRGQMQQSS